MLIKSGRAISKLAGSRGFEPRSRVLETRSLPLAYDPLAKILSALGFLVQGMLPAPLTKFFGLDFSLHFLLVLARKIINPFADGTLKLD